MITFKLITSFLCLLVVIKNKILDKKTVGILSTLVRGFKNYADLRLQIDASADFTSLPVTSVYTSALTVRVA